eukprot:CAMPEP_0172534756 /NCGR_PEP_ID=MMETSP1067-20121228/7013_1 /TAXON_ID=265564 ORGANISM="Thalassiosira punctigera, Strain Tpunct2005C2" /NCGR_SAMPLE_ID=MMETSP1067 /ASSEMBLY_ACC=CAM_ASM_000444 /LENGTH=576 /DNA_ID=CAMNT_0013319585 /DNA_START=66 /DNA_END=1796 /DNA_ORIENTATION=+
MTTPAIPTLHTTVFKDMTNRFSSDMEEVAMNVKTTEQLQSKVTPPSSFLSGASLRNKVELRDILRVGLATKPDEVALFTNSSPLTWRELDTASCNAAQGLLQLGAKPGDRIASLMPNCAELIVHYVACMKVGLVMTPLNYRYSPAEIDHALTLSGATILLAHVGERQDDLLKLKAKPALGIVAFGRKEGATDCNYLADFEILTQGQSKGINDVSNNNYPEAEGDSPAIIFFTSGSTGKPKGVTHTFNTYGHCLASMIQANDMTAQDVVMPASSMSHAAAFLWSFSGLAMGAQVVVAPDSSADIVLPLFRKTRPTIVFFLPSSLLALVRDTRAQRADFASVRLLQSGGDKVADLLQKECISTTGIRISEEFGMSEAAPITLNFESEDKPGSIGKAVPGLTLSIRDVATKREVPLGQDGRLWIRGPLVMVGYWENPTATCDSFEDDWLDTGDVVRADEDGYIWFCGRQKQIIIHDGSNISPLEVENVLMTHHAVDQAGVVGVPDVAHGENVKAYVTLRARGSEGGDTSNTEKELIQFCKARIGYKAPETIEFLPFMPLNPAGKVDRNALKQNARRESR